MRGKGIRGVRGTGDLYIVVSVEIPSKLTREQKKMIEDFDANLDVKQCDKMKRYRDNMQAMYGKDPY